MSSENSAVRTLRAGFIGAGFWGRFQIAAWRELPGVQIAAVCDRNTVAAASAARIAENAVLYSDAAEMLASEALDFIDIAASPDAHEHLVSMAAERHIPVICQKPMAPDYETARRMVEECERAGTQLLIHENYRWQAPMRRIKTILTEGRIGQPFRAHIQFSHGDLALFENQPYLFAEPHFAMLDMGPHLFDLARFFFGEPASVYAREYRINDKFVGEDVVSAVLGWERLTCTCELSWRTTGYEVFIEGARGTIVWDPAFGVRVDTDAGVTVDEMRPEPYPWADPAYGFAHSSIVATNRNLLSALRGDGEAETTGRDNLNTMRLLSLALKSAAAGQVLSVRDRASAPASAV